MAFLIIVNGWNQIEPPDLIAELRFVIQKMVGNSNFSTPNPPLATITTLVNDYEQLAGEAEDGGSFDKAERDSKAQELISAMHVLSAYVLMTANGSALVVESSGLKLSKTPSPSPSIEKPAGLQLTDGVNIGELLLKFTKVKGSKSYMYQISLDPTDPAKWVTYYGTIRQNLFTGLESGKKYYVRVVAVGTDSQVVYSDVVSRIAQ
jgi:hypothetical protein